ncbi:TIGR02453 family protein [Mycobacterium sp. shizuoka-1]|nr:TIGR02453 family protein [Mycobacterium sp. shizuoka-1]
MSHNVGMAFRGWPIEAVEFYEGLEADNSKVYWTRHKAVYDGQVKAPMQELLAELADEFGAGTLFRPHRDVRFSADKAPYKTNCAARLGSGYVSFSADGLSVGSGLYMPEPAALARYRAAVDAPKSGAELAAIVAALHADGYDTMAHEILKTAPRGFPKDHPRIDLLRHKGIAMMKTWPVGAWLGTAKAKDRVVTALRAGTPLRDWLARNVG